MGQQQSLLANDVESSSETSEPVLAVVHGLFADGIESTSEATNPVLTTGVVTTYYYSRLLTG